jgi:hypothetical protein
LNLTVCIPFNQEKPLLYTYGQIQGLTPEKRWVACIHGF